ncbi:MAG: DUF2550 family protein [Streptosporangiaceae bacterium]
MAGGLAFDAGWLLIVVLIAGLAAAIGIAVRRTLLERGGGSVECGLRRGAYQNWQLGLAVYQPDELRWYSAFGVRMRPGAVFSRRTLRILSRRPADAVEAASLGAGAIVLECSVGGPVSTARPLVPAPGPETPVQDSTFPDSRLQNGTGPDGSAHGSTAHGSTAHESTAHESTAHRSTAPGSTAPGSAAQESTGAQSAVAGGSPAGDGVRRVELAMSEAALTGFLAWLESAPPGGPAGFD